ncbi:unnamed protein product [Adineta steineri]|uniref:G-protein coupled receptors family 1 profile domain-containing protein n=1 Tax=Adineta steineri TaxID=433720 RepID=A0A818V7W6_9BILA|nr:unnamed protein product [Adineta steineri]CAF3708870.1 unnamed protein product [Adineta steineri]
MFTRYWCMTMFIVGFIGHSLNLYVFTRRTLRFNPCVRYLIASSIAGYLIIFIILPLRLLQFGYNISLFVPSIILCKYLTFLCSWIRILPCWFIALASVDRYFFTSSSRILNSWSSIRASNCFIFLSIVFVGLTQTPILFYFTIDPQIMRCLGQPNSFQKFNGILIMIIWSFIPSLAMLIFGFLTINNTQKLAQNITDQNITKPKRKRTKFLDRQLIQITLIQSILFGLTSAAGAIGGMHNVLNNNLRKDRIALARQSQIGNILSFIGLLSPCISFYLCTLSSRLFRRKLIKLFHVRQQNHVQSVTNGLHMSLRTR